MNINKKLMSKVVSKFGRSYSVFSKSSPLEGKYGQPTEWTHPHIIGQGEVNKGIQKSEFRTRREKIAENLIAEKISLKNNQTGDKHLLIVPAAKRQYMVDKIPYFYRQETDFRYLTGCLQPDTVLVIEFSSNWSKSVLFCKESSPYDEKWEGAKIGYGEAVNFLGFDEASPLSSLEDYLYNFKKLNPKLDVWYDYMDPTNFDIHKIMLNFIQDTNINNIDSPRSTLHNMRVVKSPAEVSLMRTSCAVGAEAMKRTIRRSKSLSTEGQFLASVEFESRMQGANYLAYPPVVAAGNNANTIHYIASTSAVHPSELVLMDAGCEFHGYASDITRTWPAGGSFSDPQRCVYEAVLDTQQRLIRGIVPGVTTINGLYNDMQDILGKNLQNIGLIDPNDEKYLSARTHEFCPHHVSHYLGMDVHDCGKASKKQPLLPGMVITVEPGCYIPASKGTVDRRFRGIGCRLEDDVLITENGVEVLSDGCPNTIEELEGLIA
eukprot:GFUD01026570.1.p1 GENE.GFUD01026570.1~~GFUD01026570.1.p1  ORF type:complete len:491 (+),score=99.26 GFUD01026570.1:57-1529(+)